MKKTSLIQIRVTDSEREHIDSLANSEGRSTAGYIRHILFDPDLPQMEHLATDPSHRPVAEPLSVTSTTTVPVDAAMVSTFPAAFPSLERQKTAQQQRDDILRGIATKRSKP